MIALRTKVLFEKTCKGRTGELCVSDLLVTSAINKKPPAKEQTVLGLPQPQSFPSKRASTNNEMPNMAAKVPR